MFIQATALFLFLASLCPGNSFDGRQGCFISSESKTYNIHNGARRLDIDFQVMVIRKKERTYYIRHHNGETFQVSVEEESKP